MKNFKTTYNHESGMGLIGMALMVLAVSFMLTGGLYLMKNYDVIHADQENIDNLRVIEAAIADFVALEKRLPCPAPLNIAPDTTAGDGTEFGKEGAGNCTGTVHNGTFRVTGRDGMRVRVGAVPVRSLHLSDDLIIDGYGKRYVYAVTESLATSGADVMNAPGAITIENKKGESVSKIPGHVTYSLISMGQDDRGAFDLQGNMILPCESGTDAGKNCRFLSAGGNATFIASLEKNFTGESDSFAHTVTFQANAMPHQWVTQAWSECNGVCKTGIQNRSVQCRDAENVVVADSNCSHMAKPIAGRSCGLPACYWDSSAWGSCNGVCVSGTQSRSVQCKNYKHRVVANGYCTGLSRPVDSRNCTLGPCRWDSGNWSSCPSSGKNEGTGPNDGRGGRRDGT